MHLFTSLSQQERQSRHNGYETQENYHKNQQNVIHDFIS
jgi:hypothetical protein